MVTEIMDEARYFNLMELAENVNPDSCLWISTGRCVVACTPNEAARKALHIMLRKKNVSMTEAYLQDRKDNTMYVYEGKWKYLKEPRVIQRTLTQHHSECEEDDPQECERLKCRELKRSYTISKTVTVKLLSSFQIN